MSQAMMFGDIHLKAVGDVLKSSSLDCRGELPAKAHDGINELWKDAHKITIDIHKASCDLASKDPHAGLQASDEAWYMYGQLRLSMERQKEAFAMLGRMLYSLDNNAYGNKTAAGKDGYSSRSSMNRPHPAEDIENGKLGPIGSSRVRPYISDAPPQLRTYFASNGSGLFHDTSVASGTIRVSEETVPIMHMGTEGPPSILQFLLGQSRKPTDRFSTKVLGSGERLPPSPDISEIDPPVMSRANVSSHGIY